MPLPKNAEELAGKSTSKLSVERRKQIIEHIRAGDAVPGAKDKTLNQIIANGGEEGAFVQELTKG